MEYCSTQEHVLSSVRFLKSFFYPNGLVSSLGVFTYLQTGPPFLCSRSITFSLIFISSVHFGRAQSFPHHQLNFLQNELSFILTLHFKSPYTLSSHTSGLSNSYLSVLMTYCSCFKAIILSCILMKIF